MLWSLILPYKVLSSLLKSHNATNASGKSRERRTAESREEQVENMVKARMFGQMELAPQILRTDKRQRLHRWGTLAYTPMTRSHRGRGIKSSAGRLPLGPKGNEATQFSLEPKPGSQRPAENGQGQPSGNKSDPEVGTGSRRALRLRAPSGSAKEHEGARTSARRTAEVFQ